MSRPDFQLRQLVAASFLRELHHLLWTESRMVDNQVDAGWNCRDHAWILSFLLRSFGFENAVAHGEAFFAAGPAAKRPTISYAQTPHSWILVKDLGHIDLSIKPDFVSAGDVFSVPIAWVFLNKASVGNKCDTRFFSDAAAYRRTIGNTIDQLPERRNHISAAYCISGYEILGSDHLEFAAGWLRSGLADRLGARYGNPSRLYAALLEHLRGILHGTTPGLSALSFDDAWAVLAERQHHPAEQPLRAMTPRTRPAATRLSA
jgi:hypothetical protein